MPEEIPEIHIDHRSHHGQEKTIIEVDEIDEVVPVKIKFSIHRMRSLKDNTLQEIRRPPREYVNIWVKLEYGDWLCPVLFEEDGRPYIMVPPKHQEMDTVLDAIVAEVVGPKLTEVQVYIREENAEELMELLKVATDFCDYCGKPLKTSGGPDSCLEHDTESIADIYSCRFCEMLSLRWSKSFLEWHPILQDMADAAHMRLKTR